MSKLKFQISFQPFARDLGADSQFNYMQRDRDRSYKTYWTQWHGHKVSDGFPEHTIGLEGIKDK